MKRSKKTGLAVLTLVASAAVAVLVVQMVTDDPAAAVAERERTERQLSTETMASMFRTVANCQSDLRLFSVESECHDGFELRGCDQQKTFYAKEEYARRTFRETTKCDEAVLVETSNHFCGCKYQITGCGVSMELDSMSPKERTSCSSW